MTFDTGDDMYRYMFATPEWRALDAVHDRLLAHRGPWRDLVHALGQALPDHYITDWTPWTLAEPTYVVEILAKAPHRTSVVGQVSGLAPVYYIYESWGGRQAELPESPEAVPLIERLESEIRARYPYHRLDHATGVTPVPGIQVGNLTYGEVTLIDALFSPARW